MLFFSGTVPAVQDNSLFPLLSRIGNEPGGRVKISTIQAELGRGRRRIDHAVQAGLVGAVVVRTTGRGRPATLLFLTEAGWREYYAQLMQAAR